MSTVPSPLATPATTPKTVPMFSPDGEYAEVPSDQVAKAQELKFTPGHRMTTPDGLDAVVPHDQLGTALKNGFKVGPTSQQNLAPTKTPKVLTPSGQEDNPGFFNSLLRAAIPLEPPPTYATTDKDGNPVLQRYTQEDAESGKPVLPGQKPASGKTQTSLATGTTPTALRQTRDLARVTSVEEKQAVEAGVPLWQWREAATPEAKQQLMQTYHQGTVDKLAEQVPIIGSHIAEGAKAIQDVQRPGFLPKVSAAGHALAAAVPLVGPMAAGAGETMGQGKFKQGLAQALVAGGPSALEMGTENLPRSAERAVPVGEVTAPPAEGRIAGTVQTGLTKILGGGEKAAMKTPTQPAEGTTTTNADVADYAKEHGIELTPAQASQAPALKAIQAVGERGVTPGTQGLRDLLDRQKTQFANTVQDFKQRVGNEYTPDPESVGEHLKSQAVEKLNDAKAKAQADYATWEKATKGAPFDVDLSNVKSKYSDKLSEMEQALQNTPAEYATPLRSMLQKVANIEADTPGNLELGPVAMKSLKGLGPKALQSLNPDLQAGTLVKNRTAQLMRSAYSDIANDYTGNVPTRVQKLAGEISQDIGSAMNKSADRAGVLDEWKQANAGWKDLQKTYNTKGQPASDILANEDPQKVTESLLQQGKYGGNARKVRALNQQGFDLSPLRQQVLSDIHSSNFKLTNGGNGMGGYSVPFLRELFEPAQVAELIKLGRVGRAIGYEMNPSGTSNVMEASKQLSGLQLKHALPGAAGAAAGLALGGPVGAVIGGVTGLGSEFAAPELASRYSSNPANVESALGRTRPAFMKSSERGSATTDQANDLTRAVQAVKSAGLVDVDARNSEPDTEPTRMVADGHHRLQAMENLGMKTAPAVVVDNPNSNVPFLSKATSGTSESGAVKPELLDDLGMYSKLAATIDEKMPAKFPRSQLEGIIAKMPKEEQSWINPSDVRALPDKVTKEQALNLAQESKPEFSVKINKDPSDLQGELDALSNKISSEKLGKNFDELQSNQKHMVYELAVEQFKHGYLGEPHYDQYQLPGATNYKEHLFQLLTPADKFAKQTLGFHPDLSTSERYDDHPFEPYTPEEPTKKWYDNQDKYKELIEKEPEPYAAPHFNTPNMLMHLRTNERVMPDGNKALTIETLQSDWHQAGRQNGYQGEPSEKQKQIWGTNQPSESERDNAQPPDAPFKTSWPELGLKYALREAVKSGADKLAWTSGEQQANRWHSAPEEGMKGFYDDILPNLMNKYAKKWGTHTKLEDAGEATQPATIYRLNSNPNQVLVDFADKPGTNMSWDELEKITGQKFDEKFRKDGVAAWKQKVKEPIGKIHTIEITPQMKEDIMKGQPISGIEDNQKPRLPFLRSQEEAV
jgi:hypothetical protein